MDAKAFREAAHAAIEDVISYFTSVSSLRVLPSIEPGYLRPLLPTSPPDSPQPSSSILADIKSHIIPGLTHWQSPRFMAFFPATATYPSILGEIFSAAFTAPAFNWLCSPACTELETIVLDWLAGMLGLPECFLSTGSTNGGGVIQGTASEAICNVMFAAREAAVTKVLEQEGLAERLGEDETRTRQREDRAADVRARLVALGSDQAHSATQKAANILGVRFRSIHTGRAAGFRMTGAAVKAKLDECKAQGLQPFYLTATLGTTATCAVDELGEIAELKKQWEQQESSPFWVHVDGAYAGAVLLCEEFRDAAKSQYLGEFDSFDLNMHKWLMVNFDASCLFLRDRRPLTTAMSITPAYLVNPAHVSGLVTDYRDWQIPLGRRFRSLKIWFVIRTYGVKGLQALVRKHVALGEFCASLVKTRPDLFEIVAGPAFALTVLRCVGAPGDGEAERNKLTKDVCELVNSRGEFFVTGTVVDGWYVIRVVSANEQADDKFVKMAFEAIVGATEEVAAARGNDSGDPHVNGQGAVNGAKGQ